MSWLLFWLLVQDLMSNYWPCSRLFYIYLLSSETETLCFFFLRIYNRHFGFFSDICPNIGCWDLWVGDILLSHLWFSFLCFYKDSQVLGLSASIEGASALSCPEILSSLASLLTGLFLTIQKCFTLGKHHYKKISVHLGTGSDPDFSFR